jgi:F0F1-type ATP synthase membrane subunit b/b'
MINFFLSFFKPSLASILSILSNLVAKLEAHAEKLSTKADALRIQAAALHIEADKHVDEAIDASRVAANVAKLLA